MSDGVPEPKPPAAGASKRPLPIRLIIVVGVAVYAVLFVLLNSEAVEVSFVFFAAEISLVVALGLALALGLVAGYLIDTLRERRGRAKKTTSP